MVESKVHTCDWCSEFAYLKAEVKKKKRSGMIGTGLFWYSCTKHREQLQELADGAKSDIQVVLF